MSEREQVIIVGGVAGERLRVQSTPLTGQGIFLTARKVFGMKLTYRGSRRLRHHAFRPSSIGKVSSGVVVQPLNPEAALAAAPPLHLRIIVA